MKCIYCNSEDNLTSSDIITYAITGAKLKKTFVCCKHNAFTNDSYEKNFLADLDFFRNILGLSTRNGKDIKYKADIELSDGRIFKNIKISNRESVFAPKKIISTTDEDGNKVLIGDINEIKKISNEKYSVINMDDVKINKHFLLNIFFSDYALHSIAKMAYEWYCYINNIEELKEENSEIVNYILGKNDNNIVDIISQEEHYNHIDILSDVGTNSFFQYDDIDGYRYVVFDFWNIISYRIKICQSINLLNKNSFLKRININLYDLDGTVKNQLFLIFNKLSTFKTVQPSEINGNLAIFFVDKIKKLLKTNIWSVKNLKRIVDIITKNLKQYDENKIGIEKLLDYENPQIIMALDILNKLYINKTKYDKSKSFNRNLYIILKLENDTIFITQDEINELKKAIKEMNDKKELSSYIWNGIKTFDEIYKNEMEQR